MGSVSPAVAWPLTVLTVGSPALPRDSLTASPPELRLRWVPDALRALLELDSCGCGAVVVPTDVRDVPVAVLVARIREHRDLPVLAAVADGTAGAAAEAVGAGAAGLIELPLAAEPLRRALSAAARDDRRGQGDRIFVGGVSIDLGGYRVIGPEGRSAQLSVQQLTCMLLLARAWPALVRADHLAARLGFEGPQAVERTRRAIARLRRQLQPAAVGAEFIENVRGVGYRLNADRLQVHVPGRERLTAQGRS